MSSGPYDMFDYLVWRGDLTFAQDGLNDVDNLVFASLAYLPFDDIFQQEDGLSEIMLAEVSRDYHEVTDKIAEIDYNPFFRRLPTLFHQAAATSRFADVCISNYVNIIDETHTKQLAAVVFSMNPQQHYVAFRGTDDTITGWKEDFRMSFMDEVPAQKQAVGYLTNVSTKLPGQLYLGGHSKGGNLAAYCAAHIGNHLLKRVERVYNNDGPGFQPLIANSEGCQSMLSKLQTFIPKSSVIGILLEHPGGYEIVKSSEISILQHNPLTWEINGDSFVKEEELARASVALSNTVTSWLDLLSKDERAEFVEIMFSALEATGARTLQELTHEKLALSVNVIKAYKDMDKPTRTLLKRIIKLFFRQGSKSIADIIRTDINALFARRTKDKVSFEEPLPILLKG
ncbi:MAG: DUF2974 domain-containing protein [Dehalococcoidia bacterium]|nr:DUF2974 domain-containing protein [Dehalococcoidia bacterium]